MHRESLKLECSVCRHEACRLHRIRPRQGSYRWSPDNLGRAHLRLNSQLSSSYVLMIHGSLYVKSNEIYLLSSKPHMWLDFYRKVALEYNGRCQRILGISWITIDIPINYNVFRKPILLYYKAIGRWGSVMLGTSTMSIKLKNCLPF